MGVGYNDPPVPCVSMGVGYDDPPAPCIFMGVSCNDPPAPYISMIVSCDDPLTPTEVPAAMIHRLPVSPRVLEDASHCFSNKV